MEASDIREYYANLAFDKYKQIDFLKQHLLLCLS